jgi:chromosome segregation protein
MGRDGQSTYFINNAVARRRDVQDLFLGTGLGGNSYAIIEQGIISSMVGAKPEELRSYVEEAAGISKYKERKRETESRIRRTAENISRLKDLEDEVKRSIRRLKAEANLTSRYKKLRTKEQEFQKFIVSEDLKVLLASMSESQKENDSIDKDLEKIDGDRLNFVAKRDVIKTQLMEGLKKLEEEQRSFFEAGAKISLIEEKERTVNARIQDLINEEKKNLGNLDDLSNELGTSKNKIDQLDAKIIEQIKSDTKKALAKVESSLTKNDEGNLTESFRSFWQKGYDFGQGQSGDASEKIEALKKQFLERNNQIIQDIESLKKDLNKEKSELTSFIELRKNQELKVMELKTNQDKSNEELRKSETEITKLETEKDRIVHQRNEKELNKRSIEIEVKEKQEKLNSFDEIKDIEGEREDIIVELDKLQKRIMNLGPINFAAPETLEAEVQRKEVLSGQIEELEVSLNKLDEAIKKIDRESNKSFHDCLNSVNKHLEEMFPKLFGGGFCKLDLLDKTEDSGLLLMARLPGKKNTKLSQLSGGEKALTALALVFSLFSINPAPFCLLDEVDAPLDDENTSRFINLVNEMSTKVQFIFVTHNKISMEKSTHLLGVTMRDLGVSKVVSVDVEQAMELAQS